MFNSDVVVRRKSLDEERKRKGKLGKITNCAQTQKLMMMMFFVFVVSKFQVQIRAWIAAASVLDSGGQPASQSAWLKTDGGSFPRIV